MSGQQDVPAWMAAWMRPLTAWQSGVAAPELNQAINPGWTFGSTVNVTEVNSSSPATEKAIVTEESYGRQLGHVIEALADVIRERPAAKGQTAAMKKLIALETKIAVVKAQRVEARLAEIESFLADVRKSDPAKFAELARALRSALDNKA